LRHSLLTPRAQATNRLGDYPAIWTARPKKFWNSWRRAGIGAVESADRDMSDNRASKDPPAPSDERVAIPPAPKPSVSQTSQQPEQGRAATPLTQGRVHAPTLSGWPPPASQLSANQPSLPPISSMRSSFSAASKSTLSSRPPTMHDLEEGWATPPKGPLVSSRPPTMHDLEEGWAAPPKGPLVSSRPPTMHDLEEGWATPPKGPLVSSRPPTMHDLEEGWAAIPKSISSSSTPPALDDDEEGWDTTPTTRLVAAPNVEPKAAPLQSEANESHPLVSAPSFEAPKSRPKAEGPNPQSAQPLVKSNPPRFEPPSVRNPKSQAPQSYQPATAARLDALARRRAEDTTKLAPLVEWDPPAKHGVTSTTEPRELVESQPKPSDGLRTALLGIAAAVVVAAGTWLLLRTGGNAPTKAELAARESAAMSVPPKLDVVPSSEVAGPEPQTAEAANRVPEPSLPPNAALADNVRTAPSALASNAPVQPETAAAPSALASNAPAQSEVAAAEPAPNPSGVIVVTVHTVPPDARFYAKGKPVGKAPLRLELKPGERRIFEIGRDGYLPRRVVVDSSTREFTVGMRPNAPKAPASTPATAAAATPAPTPSP
jgi:hypothetical protein